MYSQTSTVLSCSSVGCLWASVCSCTLDWYSDTLREGGRGGREGGGRGEGREGERRIGGEGGREKGREGDRGNYWVVVRRKQ